MMFIAQLISFISNPIFLAFPIPFLLVYHQTSDPYYAFKWMIFSMLFIMLVGVFVLYEVKRHVFSDIDVSKREQRPLLFIFVGFVAFLYLLSLYALDAPTSLYVAVGGILGSVVVLAFINKKIKASIHVATIASFLCVLSLLYGGVHVLWLLGIPLVAWSRITTKRHSIPETIVGCIMGIVLTLGVYMSVKLIV